MNEGAVNLSMLLLNSNAHDLILMVVLNAPVKVLWEVNLMSSLLMPYFNCKTNQ